MLEKIINIIFPKCCGICGKIYKEWICPKCYYNLKNELKFQKINKNNLKLYYVGFYEGKIRKLLLKYKFNDSAYLSNTFAKIINKNQKFVEIIKGYDYIIPVPMFIKNKKIRGYNQTELLAKKMEKITGTKSLVNILIKSKQNKRQSELSEKERKENVKNVYCLVNEEKIENKKILLIDDIYTTGNTMKECVKTLKKGKPKKVDCFVIAKRN